MKRWFIGLIVAAIILAGLGTGGFFGLGFWLSPQSPLTKADAIVAISGGETEARAAEAVRLYRDGWAPHLIFSGAASDPSSRSNARAMAASAEAAGVPAAAIALDEAAANTTQNANGVAVIVQKQGYHSMILVTSPYHQRRSYITFQRKLASVTIINHSSPDKSWRRSHWWATSYSINLSLSEFQKALYVMWVER